MTRHYGTAIVAAMLCAGTAYGGVIFVDASAPGPMHDGASWGTAYSNPWDALRAATINDSIWVADGTYMPDGGFIPVLGSFSSGNGSRARTFQLADTVTLLGGFAGGEDPATFDLSTRDFVTNETILSGDLQNNDGAIGSGRADDAARSENSYHVLTGSDTGNTPVLDGFTVYGGNADGPDPGQGDGGGMYNSAGSPTVRNCLFFQNIAHFGGAMLNTAGSKPAISDCVFRENLAFYGTSGRGGGIDNDGSFATLTDCLFERNESGANGGGLTRQGLAGEYDGHAMRLL